jgi:dipeptidyl aminopeptidase/acylaminoacyl peptidase
MRLPAGLLVVLLVGAACSGGQAAAHRPAPARPSHAALPATVHPAPAVAPLPAPTPALPPYAIESLRARAYPGGQLAIGAQMFRGQAFTKYQMTWPSGGQTMTGTISLPDGAGPFPVVVVNHGHIPADRYWVGQDSGIFGDPLAAHGFISVAPNWPGYAGSGPGPADLPPIVSQVVTALDLVSSLATVPRADTSRIAFVGHSNGGGISEIAMVVDPRIRAVVLQAPVSTDMADNARRWWLQTPQTLAGLGSPDTNPDGYRHLSPRNYLETWQGPVLMIQGTSDHTIPADWTNATYAALQQKGIRSQLTWIPGADHDLVGTDLANAVAAEEAWIRQAFNTR